jgi:hypothetical protein
LGLLEDRSGAVQRGPVRRLGWAQNP